MTDEQKPVDREWHLNPNDVPQSERLATMHIVWTKAGQVYFEYPQDVVLVLKLCAMVMDAVAETEKKRAAAAGVKPLIVSPSGPVSIDPRLLPRKH